MKFDSLTRLLPTSNDYRGLRRSWPRDLVAGLTVAIVALPLALAFGIASGLGAAAGLITAIVAGIIAGIFGGSSVQVSGPTGAMTVVLAPVVASMGVDGAMMVTFAAGIVLIGAGASRLGRYVDFLPWPVIEGFTVGIGCIIFLQQVPAALGVTTPDAQNTAVNALLALGDIATAQWQALAVVAIIACAMLLLPRLHRTLPASLIGVAVATLIAEIGNWPIARIGKIPSSLPAPQLPSLDFSALPTMFSAVLAIAALAAIESLLSARVADGMTDEDRHDPDRELFGQGLASIGSSLFGGMPATGAIARTAVNVRAGARTRAAAIAHGLLLAIVVLALTPFIAVIPIAALSGVLMVTAIHMIEFGTVRRIVRSTRGDALVLLATATATVVFDLVVAVEVGVVLAGIIALRSLANESTFDRDDLSGIDIDAQTEHALLDSHAVAYQLDGALFFGAAQRFLLELTDISDVEVVILRLGKLSVLDATGAQALGDLVERLQHRNITVLLACVRPEHRLLISRIGVLDALAHEDHVVSTIDEALDFVRQRSEFGAEQKEPAELAAV